MKMENIKNGMIVVVEEGKAFGCKPQTITKVLTTTGCNDEIFLNLGERKNLNERGQTPIVLCKASKKVFAYQTFRNIPCFMEFAFDLRPATKEEKKLFRKNNYDPIQIPYHD
jgi:hypothetical protein